MKDILSRFRKLHEEAMLADEPRLSSSIFTKAMEKLIDKDPEAAEELVSCYEGLLHYNNYLTEDEAKQVVTKLESSTGSTGPKWSCQEVFDCLTRHGLQTEDPPHYNKWALYTQINIIASDHDEILSEWSGNNRDRYFLMCYQLSKSQLTDKDKPIFIRWYTEID